MKYEIKTNLIINFKGLKIFCFSSVSPKLNFTGRNSTTGFGIDKDEEMAELKAKNEYMEVQAASIFNLKKLLYTSYQKLPDKKMDSPFFKQPFYNFKKQQNYYWLKVKSHKYAEEVFAPASFFYFPFDADEKPINIQNSIGLSTHISKESALLKSIFENFERHYFLRAWNDMQYVNRIKSEQFKSDSIEYFEILNDIGLFIICAVIYKKAPPFYTFGIGVDVSLKDALQKAKLEARFGEFYNLKLLSKIQDEAEKFDFAIYAVSGFFHHAFFRKFGVTQEKWRSLDKKKVKSKPFFDKNIIVEKFGDFFYTFFPIPKNENANNLFVCKVFIPTLITDYRHFLLMKKHNKYLSPI